MALGLVSAKSDECLDKDSEKILRNDSQKGRGNGSRGGGGSGSGGSGGGGSRGGRGSGGGIGGHGNDNGGDGNQSTLVCPSAVHLLHGTEVIVSTSRGDCFFIEGLFCVHVLSTMVLVEKSRLVCAQALCIWYVEQAPSCASLCGAKCAYAKD